MEIVARTFEFIEASLGTRSCDELTALVMRTVEPFGVTSFLDSGVPRPGERCSDHVLINAWPSGWYGRYTSRRYFEIDPVIGLLQQTTMPFRWSVAARELPPVATGAVVADEAAEFGMKDGFTIPIFSRTGEVSGATFGGEELDGDPQRIGALRLIATYAHDRAREFAESDDGGGRRSSGRPFRPLSPRELDCLRWTAEGKSSWEISAILGIRPKSVDNVIARACVKLDACNRTRAVAVAIRESII